MHKEMREGLRAGVTGAASFFIEGLLRSGAQPLERFVSTIEEELARAG
jgi:predicted DsbA family dithiol-disulfide isomerase